MVYKYFVDPAQEVEYMALPAETCQPTFEPTCQPAGPPTPQGNFQWKYVGLLPFVWLVFLILQILKNGVHTCSIQYWVINLVQVGFPLCPNHVRTCRKILLTDQMKSVDCDVLIFLLHHQVSCSAHPLTQNQLH
jgi:hypothetical protein